MTGRRRNMEPDGGTAPPRSGEAVEGRDYLTARQAAAALGISLPTLYAYASRGLLRSEEMPGKTRARRYPRSDIERLRLRQEMRRSPEAGAPRTLSWGMPVLESAITLIDGSRFYYRGHRARPRFAWPRLCAGRPSG